jgi:hypothetical protein
LSSRRSFGATDLRIMAQHILPNVIAPVIVVFSIGIGAYILAEASLSFLGLGPADKTTWGKMVNSAASPWIFTRGSPVRRLRHYHHRARLQLAGDALATSSTRGCAGGSVVLPDAGGGHATHSEAMERSRVASGTPAPRPACG